MGKVRALLTDIGANTTNAGPSMPVEILGFNSAPEAGDRMAVVENEARAREIADYRDRKKREKAQARLSGAKTSLADLMSTNQNNWPQRSAAGCEGRCARLYRSD